LKKAEYILTTVHRADNVDNPERLHWFVDLLERAPAPVLFPIHPRTKKRLAAQHLLKRVESLDHVITANPLGYFETLNAAQSARVVVTDSGGLQKESLFLGTPALVMRSETEWTETLKLGNRLVDHGADRIIRFIKRPPTTKKIRSRMGGKEPSALIVAELRKFFKKAK
jgi:UDP-N-acetylglucosamine 2-epimerase